MKLFLSLIITLIALKTTGQEALNFPVEKYQLDNGLTVLLYRDTSTPLVSFHTWIRVGSKDEEKGFTGMAHLFEHLMFKGSKKFSNKEYDRILKEIGANNNAFTSRDYTGYYVNASSEHLELIMDLESDRFQNLILTEDNLKSERDVVKEERRFRVENRIEGVVFEKINELAYTSHSYRWPVIGYIEDLDNISLQKAKEFYRTFYSPNNAVLMVAGDIQVEKVKKLVDKYYGHMKAQPIERPQYPIDPDQKKQKEHVFYRDIQSDYLTVSFVVPSQTSPEIYAVEMLAEILGKGESSRLYKKLVYDQQIATSVSVFLMSNYHSSVLQIHVRLKPAKTRQLADQQKNKALAQIWTELFQLRNYHVKPNELLKAKNKIIKDYVDNLKTMHGKAYSLAMNETVLGDYKKLFSDLESYQRVLEKDIQFVAEKYLIQKRSNIVLARPTQYK
jgi:zinc protease